MLWLQGDLLSQYLHLFFLGLTPTEANATNRVAILIQNIAAVTSFKRDNYHQFNVSLKLALFAAPGALLGAIVAVEIGDELFQKILGIILIAVAVTMLITKSQKKNKDEVATDRIPIKAFAAMFVAGLYGGFIQIGVGFILMAGLRWGLQTNLVKVNMHKVFVVLVYTIPAVLVFMVSGKIDYLLGFILAGGNALGGWWAAKVSVKRGEKVIKVFMVVVIIIMALKLFEVI